MIRNALLLILLCPAARAADKALSVAVAANMMPVMEELRGPFRAATGVDLALTPGASGKIATQIINGAPFSLFLSADMEFPQELADRKLTDGAPARYARGTLVLWTLKDVDVSKGLAALTSDAFVKIAVADPKTAPYGRAAIGALKRAGLFDAVSKKLVYGESLSQVNQFITSQAADAGLAARSIVETKEWKDKGHWVEVDPKLYDPIDQGLVVLKAGDTKEAAKLKSFILGPKGRAVLKKYGYLVR